MRISAILLGASLLGACVTDLDTQDESTTSSEQDSELAPKHLTWTRDHHEQYQLDDSHVAPARPKRGNGISYHGGPVMLGTTNIHFIYYGNWSSGSRAILDNLASSIGGSPYFNINTTYYNGSGTHVSNSVHYSGSVNDNLSHGTSLSDSSIQAIVAAQNPTDTSGIYFVLTDPTVNETSGFCTQYCGWHTHGTIGGRDIKYAFIGNPARCINSCAFQTNGPNGDPGADGAASIISHELEEAVTDPDLNAWYDNQGEENADKCAWTFGTTYTASNGTMANMNLGGRDYLIQRNWVNASGGFCAKSF